jgi:uncharacterized membrane protein YgcG
VPAGDAFTAFQRHELEKVIAGAERLSGRRFAVHVGPSDGDSRAKAEALHARLPDPTNSILVHVDPAERALEIVTGAAVRMTLTNRQAAFAAINMQSAFATGDLERGIRAGVQQLAEFARREKSLHTDTP